jgi:hypothetical protein
MFNLQQLLSLNSSGVTSSGSSDKSADVGFPYALMLDVLVYNQQYFTVRSCNQLML